MKKTKMKNFTQYCPDTTDMVMYTQ